MTLQTPFWQTLQGDPITGAVPTNLHVMAGTLTPVQRGQINQVYRWFCTAKLTAVGEYFASDRFLPDGTRVRLESMQGRDRVYVWAPENPSVENQPLIRGWWVFPYDSRAPAGYVRDKNIALGAPGAYKPFNGVGEDKTKIYIEEKTGLVRDETKVLAGDEYWTDHKGNFLMYGGNFASYRQVPINLRAISSDVWDTVWYKGAAIAEDSTGKPWIIAIEENLALCVSVNKVLKARGRIVDGVAIGRVPGPPDFFVSPYDQVGELRWKFSPSGREALVLAVTERDWSGEERHKRAIVRLKFLPTGDPDVPFSLTHSVEVITDELTLEASSSFEPRITDGGFKWKGWKSWEVTTHDFRGFITDTREKISPEVMAVYPKGADLGKYSADVLYFVTATAAPQRMTDNLQLALEWGKETWISRTPDMTVLYEVGSIGYVSELTPDDHQWHRPPWLGPDEYWQRHTYKARTWGGVYCVGPYTTTVNLQSVSEVIGYLNSMAAGLTDTNVSTPEPMVSSNYLYWRGGAQQRLELFEARYSAIKTRQGISRALKYMRETVFHSAEYAPTYPFKYEYESYPPEGWIGYVGVLPSEGYEPYLPKVFYRLYTQYNIKLDRYLTFAPVPDYDEYRPYAHWRSRAIYQFTGRRLVDIDYAADGSEVRLEWVGDSSNTILQEVEIDNIGVQSDQAPVPTNFSIRRSGSCRAVLELAGVPIGEHSTTINNSGSIVSDPRGPVDDIITSFHLPMVKPEFFTGTQIRNFTILHADLRHGLVYGADQTTRVLPGNATAVGGAKYSAMTLTDLELKLIGNGERVNIQEYKNIPGQISNPSVPKILGCEYFRQSMLVNGSRFESVDDLGLAQTTAVKTVLELIPNLPMDPESGEFGYYPREWFDMLAGAPEKSWFPDNPKSPGLFMHSGKMWAISPESVMSDATLVLHSTGWQARTTPTVVHVRHRKEGRGGHETISTAGPINHIFPAFKGLTRE